MATDIILVSGFLGAGKTTLIQKYLQECSPEHNQKTMLIENDFGETSVDSTLLQQNGIEIKEIKSGCICCSLIGDFVEAIQEMTQNYQPERIIIEPSGVGKLSDLIKILDSPALKGVAEISNLVVVADAEICDLYLDNFGEFYADQITYADIILLTRVEDFPEEVAAARQRIRELNPDAMIIDSVEYSALDLLEPENKMPLSPKALPEGHGHSAHEVFETITLETEHKFTQAELDDFTLQLTMGTAGLILRAKGILQTESGSQEVQYTPGRMNFRPCAIQQNFICLIGQNLNRPALRQLFFA